jgi:dTDP-4-amino-4,6-dideoxygalactose transaminase
MINDVIITQSLSFAATAAAIVHAGGTPVFVDVERETLSMSPESLRQFLAENAELKNGESINKKTGKLIKAVIPMHTFKHPVRIEKIQKICNEYFLLLIEDAAESLGSFYNSKHTDTFGRAAILRFSLSILIVHSKIKEKPRVCINSFSIPLVLKVLSNRITLNQTTG